LLGLPSSDILWVWHLKTLLQLILLLPDMVGFSGVPLQVLHHMTVL